MSKYKNPNTYLKSEGSFRNVGKLPKKAAGETHDKAYKEYGKNNKGQDQSV